MYIIILLIYICLIGTQTQRTGISSLIEGIYIYILLGKN